MPKKYHRPPTTKKKKKKKASGPRVLEPLPEDQTDNSAVVVQDVAPDTDDVGDDYDDDEEFVEQPVAAPVEARRTSVSHLVTDYGYVLTELRLSIGLAAFLIAALVIIAIIR